jgi:hypothetical protein
MTFEEELAQALRPTLASARVEEDIPTVRPAFVPFGPELPAPDRDTRPSGFAAFRWSERAD